MLTLPPSVRIYMAAEAVDLRRGFDGLAAATRHVLRQDPLSGHLFCFINGRRNRMKILVWDRSGFWVLYKRLEQGSFAWPGADETEPVEMRGTDLMLLLSGVDLGGDTTPTLVRARSVKPHFVVARTESAPYIVCSGERERLHPRAA